MTVAFANQYPSSSPGTDGQVIPLEIVRPILSFSLCFTNTPALATLVLDPDWDIMEMWSTEPCMIAFDATPVVMPDGVGTIIPGAYFVGQDKVQNYARDRILLTKSADFLSAIALGNPGELFVSVLTRYQAIAIDESLQRG